MGSPLSRATADRAADLRRQYDELHTALSQMIAERQRLLADLQRIAHLVPERYRQLVVEAARQNGLDPLDVAAVIYVESRGKAGIRGRAGEIGLMQIMPATAEWIAEEMGIEEYDLRDPATNVAMGAFYLRHCLNAEGAFTEALAQYNGGPEWRTTAPREAQAYAAKVLAAKKLKGR